MDKATIQQRTATIVPWAPSDEARETPTANCAELNADDVLVELHGDRSPVELYGDSSPMELPADDITWDDARCDDE